jgi:hypothetical protein
MPVKVTMIVQTNGHTEGTVRMERTIERGSDNDRFYPSEAQHAAMVLSAWASDQLTALAGGQANTLSSVGVKMIVDQREHMRALEDAQEYYNASNGRGNLVIIGRTELEDLRSAAAEHTKLTSGNSAYVSVKQIEEWRRRDARLTALEAAGVDNWEGMDNVVFPED